jgi:urease accessory protein
LNQLLSQLFQRLLFRNWASAVALCGASSLAFAHGDPTAAHAHSGFLAGFLHPFSGWDHWLSFLSLGVVAWRGGGVARGEKRTPRANVGLITAMVFLMALCGGFALAQLFPTLPRAEFAIAAGVVLLGFVLALVARPSGVLCAVLAVGLGAAHGYVHGLELAGGVNDAIGMVAASAILVLSSAFFMVRFEHYSASAGAVRLSGTLLATLGIFALSTR